MRRALVVGASGYIGRHLAAYLGPDRCLGTWANKPTASSIYFDVATSRIRKLASSSTENLTHVFIMSGMTNPDACARDPVGTARVNVGGIQRLIDDAQSLGLTPVFVSTDYVFNGQQGLRSEDDEVSPITEYGRQKALVERWLQDRGGRWMIARLSKVVSSEATAQSVLGHWANEIKAGTPMSSAVDQIFSPAHIDDVARALVDLADKEIHGIIHVAGDVWSRYDLHRLFVDAVLEVSPEVSASLKPCSLRDLPFLEERPLNTSLSTARLERSLDWRFKPMETLVKQVAREHFAQTS